MEVILRQDVDSLGLRGEVVNVARGYARNFLLPRGLAEVATPGLVRELEKRDRQRARHEAKTGDEAKSIATRLESLELRFDVNAGPTGALFGSVTATNVADRLWESAKIRIDRRKLSMDAIKRVGRYTVPVELFPDVIAELKLVVAPEGQELPAQETLDELAAEQEAQEAAQTAAQESSGQEARAAEEAAAEPVEATPDTAGAEHEPAPTAEPDLAATGEADEAADEGSPLQAAGSGARDDAPGDDRATEPA
jgi:large subunit ribosomal protein L9